MVETLFFFKSQETCMFHREDGPAIEWEDGRKDYYLNGRKISQKDSDGHTYSDEEMLMVLKLISFI